MGAARPNIVLIVFDTARADAFEPYGAAPGSSATVAQLSSSGTAHPATFSTACWTAPSHGSMFSGDLPRSAGMAHVGGMTPAGMRTALAEVEKTLLPTVLRDAGYRTMGVSTNLWVSPDSGFDLGFDGFHYVTGLRNKGLHRTDPKGRAKWLLQALQATIDDGADAVAAFIADWLGSGDGDPFFLFVNLVECHSPYLPPKPWTDLPPWDRVRTAAEAQRHLTFNAIWRACCGGFDVPSGALDRMRHGYAASIRQMDAWLARLLSLLDGQRLLDDTHVVLTSDHGENFGEGNLMGHAFSLDDRLIRVPFVHSGPDELPLGRVLSLADVPRLLAGAADVEHPWGDRISGDVAVAQFDAPALPGDPRIVEALNLWGLGPDSVRRLTTSFTCATDGEVKLVRRPGQEELFELASDPLELVPVPADDPAADHHRHRFGGLRAALDAAEASERPQASGASTAVLPPEDVSALEDQMRLLGYL